MSIEYVAVAIENLYYFAEKFKAKINTYMFRIKIYLLYGLSFVKIVPIFNI